MAAVILQEEERSGQCNSSGISKQQEYQEGFQNTRVKSKLSVPRTKQVSEGQVGQYLNMVDYPISINTFLKKILEDKDDFEAYAISLFKSVNPYAHHLTLMTLVKDKWFEVMNAEQCAGGVLNPDVQVFIVMLVMSKICLLQKLMT